VVFTKSEFLRNIDVHNEKDFAYPSPPKMKNESFEIVEEDCPILDPVYPFFEE